MSRRRRPRSKFERVITAPVAHVPEEGRMPREPVYTARRPGRPSLLTPQVEEKYMMALRAGNYPDVAAQMCGLSPKTVERWLARGRGRDKNRPPAPEYIRFARMVDEAVAAAEVVVVGNVFNMSRSKPEAAKFFLRNRHPERWLRDRGYDGDDLPPAPAPAAGPVIEHTSTNVVVVPLEAFPEVTRQLLEQKRERRTERIASSRDPEPYDEAPPIAHDSRLSRAGLRDEA